MALNTSFVGGFAVTYHSQPRFTKDLDLFIKADPAMRRKRRMPRLPSLAHRSKASPRKISRTATASFALGASRKASISFLPSPALILTPHGNGALKPWLILSNKG